MGYREDVLREEAERIKNILSGGMLEMIRQSIPNEWVKGSSQRIEDMFIVLDKRLEMIDLITEMILKERRKQPWKSY